jgi:phospholipid-binding lipoprotein MlaA
MLAAVRRSSERLCLRARSWFAPVMLAPLLAAPAAAQAPEDPLEPLNRRIFAFNQVVDGAFAEPAAIIYEGVVPAPVRTSVHNVFLNLSEPVNILNAALQGDGERFGNSFGRLFINSTIGLGGIFDVAGNLGPEFRREYIREDFGQTLAVWGWEDSAYFVIPVLGPSTIRDTGGAAVDFATTPWGFFAPSNITIPLAAVRAVDARSQVLDQLEELERSSLDFYASLRSVYLQRRRNLIYNGNPPQPEGEDIFEEEAFFEE